MAVFIAQEECTVNVGKAWHYLLIHPEKGYYTGYKGLEAFGDLESARIYRTEQEAYMARLRAGMEVRVESSPSLGDRPMISPSLLIPRPSTVLLA